MNWLADWYPLLMVGLFAVCYYGVGYGKKKEWFGSPRTTRQDKPFLWEYEISGGRNRRPIASRMGISAVMPFLFAVEEEKWTHRLSKLLGFCEEFQTEDTDFDNRVFIISDENMFQQKLRNNFELHQLIVKAFTLGAKRIFTTPQHLVLELKAVQPEPPEDSVDALLDILNEIKRHLAGAATAEAAPLQPGAVRMFNAIGVYLLVGGIATLTLNLILGYRILEWGPMPSLLLHSSVVCFIALMVALKLALQHSSYGHDMFMKTLGYALWGIPLLCGMVIWFANCHYDASEAAAYVEKVQEKHVSHSRRSTTYNIRTANWHSANGTITLSVSSGLYNQLQVGDNVRIYAQPGYLGMEWVSKVQKTER